MKINYLKLKNIGPYVGVQYFDLNTNPSKNITLIGGKNGAGKTTFLKAIKYGLFGSFSLGFKNDTAAYFYEINSLLNNRCKSGFFIEIGFEYIENFVIYKYVLRRSWIKKKEELSESIRIFCDGNELNEFDTKEINDKIHAITSPQLINSFIFDGEKIGNVIENGEISLYLQEVFNSIFSIDLISQAKTDLNNYLAKKANDIQNKEMIENISLINKINNLKSQISSIEKNVSNEKKYINDLVQQKKSNMDSFYKLGGLTKSEQDDYNKKISLYSLEREKNNKMIKSFVESDLPIYMCYDLLGDALIQASVEKQKKFLYYIDEIEKFLNKSLEDIKSDIKSRIEFDYPVFHFLSDEEYAKLENRLADVAFSVEKIKPLLGNKHIKFDEYKMLKKSIENNQNISTLEELISSNQKIDATISILNEEVKNYESSLSSLKSDLSLYLEMYSKSSEIIKKDALYDSSFLLGKNVLDLCEKFENKLKEYKLSLVSEKALEIFCDTIRKHDFITDIKINNNYELELRNANNVLIEPKTLSAGEMQILVSSIIWAMFRISGRREMFVFDTPLARLDSENRQNFINKIISTISSQIVILSTDSEFVGENYALISSRVYRHYLLEYDEANNKTIITENYFGGKKG